MLQELPGPWLHDAECIGYPPEWWFPERGDPAREARAICARCPVRMDCLEFALRTKQGFGIWGGEGEIVRRRIRRYRQGVSA